MTYINTGMNLNRGQPLIQSQSVLANRSQPWPRTIEGAVMHDWSWCNFNIYTQIMMIIHIYIYVCVFLYIYTCSDTVLKCREIPSKLQALFSLKYIELVDMAIYCTGKVLSLLYSAGIFGNNHIILDIIYSWLFNSKRHYSCLTFYMFVQVKGILRGYTMRSIA